jgi:hypothetical protein
VATGLRATERCPPILIEVNAIPRPAGSEPHPGREPPETLAAVRQLTGRYGDRLVVSVAE